MPPACRSTPPRHWSDRPGDLRRKRRDLPESLDFTVDDNVAYETHHYESVDTPLDGGPAAGSGVVTDTGTGINIHRRGSDGLWRVARDAWAVAPS